MATSEQLTGKAPDVYCSYDDMVDVAALVPNPRNPNTHSDAQIALLAKIIDHQGWRSPITVSNRSGFIVKGHARLMAAQILNLEQAPVDRQDYANEADEWADLIADNRIAELAERDAPMLKDLLQELDNGAFDMDLTGYDMGALQDLMTQTFQPGEGLTDDDAVPEDVETVCRTGDLWILGDHRLLCGDATKEDDVARLMDGQKADLVFTDPPYGISIVRGVGTADSGGAKPFGRVRQPGGKPAGVLKGKVGRPGVVEPRLYRPVHGDDQPFDPRSLLDCASVVLLFGANHYASRLPDEAGWLVWDKGVAAKSTFSACELIWCNQGEHVRRYEHKWSGMVRAGSRDEELQDRVHPTQKPVGLLAAILGDYSQIGHTVLDPYGGSGSTLIACDKLSRRCYMMEIDEHYCDVIINRWQDYTGKTAEKA